MNTTVFKRFDPALLVFLGELRDYNNREWFAANKARYEAQVREPALQFIAAMADRLPDFAPRFTAVAKRQGGSLMRVYRDVRFSKDKQPYKTNVGIQFRHELGRDIHAPGYYFHIDPEQIFLGAGLWHPDSATLGKIRDRLVEHPRAWVNARDSAEFGKHFELAGATLKRAPRGFDPEHKLIEDLKRKDFIAICSLNVKDLYKRKFLDSVVDRYASATPLMRFLCRAVDLRF